jgi:RNA polymerase sigma-70 factor (ECF subfamily)
MRRNRRPPFEEGVVQMLEQDEFLDLYDRALPAVYGYLARRCDSAATAEDLTAEVFIVAVTAWQAEPGRQLDVGWLIGTARHKLIDHWRRSGRQRDALAELWDDMPAPVDPHDQPIEVEQAQSTLATLAPLHRSVLTLRYCDGLPVGEVASTIGRTVHATESLLTRAKAAFRNNHDPRGGQAS